MWRCQSTEAAKPRQHTVYKSTNHITGQLRDTQMLVQCIIRSYMAYFDPQDTSATVHVTQRLSRPTTSSQRAEFIPHNTHNIRAHPDASSDVPDADETPRANLRPEQRRNARTDRH